MMKQSINFWKEEQVCVQYHPACVECVTPFLDRIGLLAPVTEVLLQGMGTRVEEEKGFPLDQKKCGSFSVILPVWHKMLPLDFIM